MIAGLEGAVGLKAFALALLIFGFAPGLCLRIILRAYSREDPRRAELRAELFAVPRWDRPFWVMQQLEVALVEGLGERITSALTGRLIYRWHLESGTELNRKYPSFWVPPNHELAALQPGQTVKLLFRMRDGWSERMWVQLERRTRFGFVGRLSNMPAGIPRLAYGDRVRFRAHHIIDVSLDDDA